MNDKTLNYKLNDQANVSNAPGAVKGTNTTQASGALGDRALPRFAIVCSLCGALLLAFGAGCTLRQAYPETQIRGYINGQPFSVNAPKDSTLTGFDAVAETNGTIHVHIDSLQASLNATNLANAANGQAAIVTATGQVINQAVGQALQTAAQAMKN